MPTYEAPEVFAHVAIDKIARALPPLERVYSRIRFSILRPKLLSVMDLLLPDAGRILDVGCGFGLFAAYFGQTHPRREIVGIDPNARRIAMAERVARSSVSNVIASSRVTCATRASKVHSTRSTCST